MSATNEITNSGELVDTKYAGEAGEGASEYRRILDRAEERQECPFCPEFLQQGNEVLHKVSGWSVISNKWPYENAETHLLFIPDRHITDIVDVVLRDWFAIRKATAWAREQYGALMDGGALVVRYGLRSGVTVRHLHFQLITARVDPETGEVPEGGHVVFPIG